MGRKKRIKIKEFNLRSDRIERLTKRWSPYTYKLENPDSVKDILPVPDEYLEKCNRVLILSSGIGSSLYYGATLFRIDRDEIDQDPFIVAFSNDDPISGQALQIHHADYPSRTAVQTREFQRGVVVSGVATDVRIPGLPKKDSGRIEELQGVERAGFDYAFQQAVRIAIVSTEKEQAEDDE
ncbi:hypothetical protein MYX78_13680 [Acidobacteria bacterium AH-259-G07]|nr:hypothetical protein [Acidobacteria bacterium AH-259-G07]